MSVACEFSYDWVSSGVRFLSPLKGQLRPLLGIGTYQALRDCVLTENVRGRNALQPNAGVWPTLLR
jgi:hypothetical protein